MSEFNEHEHSQVDRYAAIGLAALFPGFRTFILLASIVGMIAGAVLIGMFTGPGVLQDDKILGVGGMALFLFSGVILVGVWLPAVILAWLAPKVADRVTEVTDDYFEEPNPPVRRHGFRTFAQRHMR